MKTKEAIKTILKADKKTIEHLPDGLVKKQAKKIRKRRLKKNEK